MRAPDIESEIDRLRNQLSGATAPVRRLVQDAVDSLDAAVLVTDDGGRFIAANKAACTLVGYPLLELLDKSVAEITAPHSLEVQERLWSSFSRTRRQTGRYEITRKDGRVVEISYSAFWDVAPGVHASLIRSA